jgi:carboxymethylenebutenolidase
MGEWTTIEAIDESGDFEGYLAGSGAAGIVVIQEIFGVNAGIRAMCDDWAGKGFMALAPDLFRRIEPRIDLTDRSEGEWKAAFGYMQKFNVDAGVRDVEAAIRALRARGCAKVGVVGYCLGGKMAFLAATRTDADATVSYYGGGIDALLGEAHAIARPAMLHLAVEDEYIDRDAQAKIHAQLDGHPKVEIHDYPGVQHAFARVDGVHRDDAAADLADGRTLAFFKQHLG